MKIKIKTFAALKDIFGQEMSIEINAHSSIKQLSEKLVELNPESLELIISSRIAIKENFVNQDYMLKDGDELLILPPSSGG